MDEESAANRDSFPQLKTELEGEKRAYSYQRGRYQQFHESAPIGYFVMDADNAILDVNNSGARLLGTTREKLLRSRLMSFVSAPSQGHFLSFMTSIRTTKEWHQCETELVRTDASQFCALLQGRQMGGAEELGIFVSDITQIKRTENALKESEKKYREVADLLAEGIYESDRSGTMSYANLKLRDSLGINENDFNNGTPVFEFIAARDRNSATERFARIVKGEDLGPQEYLMQRRDGTTFPALVHSLAVRREGVLVGIRGVVFEISERKRAERALTESERRYRELAEQLEEGVFEIDLSGIVTYANRKGLSSLGLAENDLKRGFSVFDIIVPQDLDVARERFAKVVRGEDIGAVEYVMIRKDGTTFPALTHSSAISQADVVVGVRGVMFDISNLKRTEQALRESEERFRTLLKSLHEGVWALDKEDRTTFVNPRMAEMLGYTEEEMLGKPVYSFNDEKWKKFTAEKMERRKQGVSEQLEGELLRKDGGRVFALFETSPILDANGNYAGSIAGVQDITDRKLAEERLKQTMAGLDRSNKELEQFAYVTSHDLREPLRMMTSFSQSLEKRYKDKLDGTAMEYIHFIVDGAARMQKLIDDILLYSRVTTRALPFESVDMNKIFQDAMANLRASVEDTKAVITHGPLPVIRADPSQMVQILQNLIANAIKFHRDEEPPVVHISAGQEGTEWIFSVKDNGIGMDPELFGRLFNLFQRLHPPDKYPGTGVGLAVTKKIVQRHEGRIWVESQPGKGSTFYFSVPLVTNREQDGRG